MILPFGISNAPASSQGYVQKILAKKLEIFVIVLRDILVYISRTKAKATLKLFDRILDVFPVRIEAVKTSQSQSQHKIFQC